MEAKENPVPFEILTFRKLFFTISSGMSSHALVTHDSTRVVEAVIFQQLPLPPTKNDR